MNRLPKSRTENIYEALKANLNESASTFEDRKNEVLAAVEDAFSRYTDDMFLGNADYTENGNDEGILTFDVTAYGGESDEDGDIELSRTVELVLPLYDINDPKMDEMTDVAVQYWIENHDSPENFYEDVTINTGSTVVTSDATGITIEDNGNNITVGNGASVDVDNIDDVIDEPAEEAIDEPIEELPEEPAEDLVDEPTEEITESIEPEEDKNKDFEERVILAYDNCNYSVKSNMPMITDILNYLDLEDNSENRHKVEEVIYNSGKDWQVEEGTTNEEVLEEPSEETSEEINNSKIEEAEQTIDIFQNPKYDYEMIDITSLTPTDAGDTRAMNMDEIIVDLDEALTERFNDPNYVILNSFSAKHGQLYSSAILDLKWPGCKGYIATFESSYKDGIYECVVRDTATNKKINHLCGKTTNPVRMFESAILDLMNLNKLSKIEEHESLTEDIELIHNHREDTTPEDTNSANDDRIENAHKKLDKELDKEKKDLKTSEKEYKVDEEPDQKNTSGEAVEELKESYSTDEIKDLIERLIDEAKKYPENNPGSLYSQVIRELRDSGIDNLADYLDECYDKCDSSYIRGSHVIEDLKYTLSKLSDMNESTKLREDELTDKEPLENDLETEEEPAEELQEETLSKATFVKAPRSVKDIQDQIDNGIVTNQSTYYECNTKEMNESEFEDFSNNLQGSYDWLAELYDTSADNKGAFTVIRVTDGNSSLLVDPNGTKQARFVALGNDMPVEDTAEETLEEPIEEPVE